MTKLRVGTGGVCDNPALFLPSSVLYWCRCRGREAKMEDFAHFHWTCLGHLGAWVWQSTFFLWRLRQLCELFLFCLGFDDSLPESDSGVLKHLAVVFSFWSFEFPVSLSSTWEDLISLVIFQFPYKMRCPLEHRMGLTLISSFHSACLWWGILKSDRIW